MCPWYRRHLKAPFLQSRKLIFPARATAEHNTGSMVIRLLKRWQEIHNAAFAAYTSSYQANLLICTLNTFCSMLSSMQISIPKYPKKSSAPTATPTAILQLGRVAFTLCSAPWHSQDSQESLEIQTALAFMYPTGTRQMGTIICKAA